MIDSGREPILLSKYVWVIETIHRQGRISFNELNDKWKRDEAISFGEDLAKRTLNRWISAIQDTFGIIIENENRGEYRYYIYNEDALSGKDIQAWLYNSICVSNALVSSVGVKDRILLEDVPSGQKYLSAIIDAMKENHVLTITYQSYWKDKQSTFDVLPYCVKLFRQRWYLVAQSTDAHYQEKGPLTYALDRIVKLEVKDETFQMPKDWHADEYFEACFGIIADKNIEPQNIKLKVSAYQAKYLRDLRLHWTQDEPVQEAEYSIFRCRVRPTYDFLQELLWNREGIEVLEPLELRQEIADIIKRMSQKYNDL